MEHRPRIELVKPGCSRLPLHLAYDAWWFPPELNGVPQCFTLMCIPLHLRTLAFMVDMEGFEPPAPCVSSRHSKPLSYMSKMEPVWPGRPLCVPVTDMAPLPGIEPGPREPRSRGHHSHATFSPVYPAHSRGYLR